MLDVFVGRQPIFNKGLKVIGYELLFRSFEGGTAVFLDGDTATREVILNAFMEIGLGTLVGNKLAFLNLTRNFIVAKYPLPLKEDQIVLEVLEDIFIDDELVEAVKALKEQGYKVALDDVVKLEAVAPLLDIVDIVKIDLVGMDQAQLPGMIDVLRRINLTLLAEKVETKEEFERCRDLGFHYFQGYYFSRPNVVKGRKLPDSHLAVMRLLSKINSPGIEFDGVEEIVKQDVALSFRLLKLINSSFYGLSKKIQSIRQALTLLGIRKIKDWVSLLALSQIEGKPRELMVTAIVRAKMSQLLAEMLHMKEADTSFTVGLFSVLDVLLDLPLEEALAQLPLSDDLHRALLNHEGPLGEVLSCVLAYEGGDWDDVHCGTLSNEEILRAYVGAVEWANGIGLII